MMRAVNPILLCIPFAALVCAVADGADAPPSDEKAMQGMWRTTSLVRDGQPTSADELRDRPVYIEIERGSIAVITAGVRGHAYRLWLDENRGVKHMDWVVTGGKDDGKHLHGVYELVGDELRICMSDAPGAERPADLKPGSGRTLWTLRRQ